jgi:NAD+ diphosphatase
MRDAEAVTLAGGTIDRASGQRTDPAALAAFSADPAARALALWRGRPLIEAAGPEGELRLGWQPLGAGLFGAAREEAVFLGIEDGAPRFALAIPDWPGVGEGDGPVPFVDARRMPHPDLPERYGFGDLRSLMAELPGDEAGAAAAAKGILGWHDSHRFCAACGTASEATDGGWRRTCPACGAQHFPRTDPVVIMLIVEGDDLLLGRSPAWPEGMYSLLAGFMEPGESIEAAVRREVFEETAVRVGEVTYLASQPWPFPSSLMIGCRGRAISRDIVRDPAELEDARWVSREGVLAGLAGLDPAVRPARKGSIARFLIEHWLADRLA